jgi:hypothetical protein
MWFSLSGARLVSTTFRFAGQGGTWRNDPLCRIK